MEKPKYLYHGSGKKLIGDTLTPKKANDLAGTKDNSLNGIYTSSVKDQAISMALHSCKGVGEGELGMHKVNGELRIQDSIIYRGWPNQKYIYLYTLPSENFHNKPLGSAQWVSFKSVKPEKIEKLLVKEHIHLVRKATDREREEFFKKHNITK